MVIIPQFMPIATRWNLMISEQNYLSFPHTSYLYQLNLPINFVTALILVTGITELLPPPFYKYWHIFYIEKFRKYFNPSHIVYLCVYSM
jgi:hypothetical protein